jgi:hypothetical protein
VRLCTADEDEEEGTAEDNSEMLPAESTSSAATYWDKLLRHHWQALEKEEGAPNRIGECKALFVVLALAARAPSTREQPHTLNRMAGCSC